jgi:DNA-binding PadR family transcriptional regulator
VLELLADREMFGLELVEFSDDDLKRGTVYMTLHLMELAGLIESWEEARPKYEGGIRRRIYREHTAGSIDQETYPDSSYSHSFTKRV